MKRYRIYINVILLVLSGAYFNGFAQTNSNIVSIQMTYPIDDTVFDPATDSIIIQIQLDDYFIWENTPPDDIGFFSLSDNFSWVNKTVTNTTLFQPSYKCVSPVYSFTEDDNIIYFWLYDPANNIDTVTSHTIVYDKPHIELPSVQPADMVTGSNHYIVYESSPELSIHAFQSFPSLNQYSLLTSIDLKETGTSYVNKLWESAAGVQDISITRDLPSEFSLSPGSSRSFTLMAAGKTKAGYDGPPDVSEEFTFDLTYLFLDVPDTICQVNSNISLAGYPPGGSFEGDGIIDNTDKFNPSLAQANAYNNITYKYIIDGQEFSVSKDIYVIDLPVIILAGEMEVAANATDVKYTIQNPDIAKYDYIWRFEGVAEIIDSTAVSVTVHWESDPASYTGKIFISLQSKNETQFCPATFEYLVDIDPDDAPDKPCICFGDINKRLLLSSNTGAAYYKWFINNEDSIGFSETPYFYLTDDIIKYHEIDNSTVFTVSIANQLTGWYTIGYMCPEISCLAPELASLLNQVNGNSDDMSVAVLANPVRESLSLKTSGNFTGQFEVMIYTMTGTLVFSGPLNKVSPVDSHEIDFQAHLNPGIYIITCRYDNRRTSPVKMVVY